MLLSLVDILRCPMAHEESALVLSVEAWHEGRIRHGMLGCPVCGSRFVVRDQVLEFGGAAGRDFIPNAAPDPAMAIRLMAQLSLTEPGGVLVLTGRYGVHAPAIAERIEATCLVLDCVPGPAAISLSAGDRLPIASDSIRGVAVDADRADAVFVMEVARVLLPGARAVLPVGTALPGGFVRQAVDEIEVVVEKPRRPSMVPLRRG